MPLGSTWWATGYVDTEWDHDFSSSGDVGYSFSGTDWYMERLYGVYKICSCDAYGSLQDSNVGFFYGISDADGKRRAIEYVKIERSQAIIPAVGSGQLPAPDTSDVVRDPYYASMFTGDPAIVSISINIWFRRPSTGTATYSVWHYQPLSFRGGVSEVIASMLLTLGLDSDYIDTDSFDDAYDYEVSELYPPEIFFRRDIGETVADSIKRIARHYDHILAVNMASQISLVHSSQESIATIGIGDVLGLVSVRYADEHICNYADAKHGQYVYTWHDNSGILFAHPGYEFWNRWAELDSTASKDINGITLDSEQDTASQAKHGVRRADQTSALVLSDGIESKRGILFYPYFYNEYQKSALLARAIDRDKDLRKEVTITQDMRGLDYDVGHRIATSGLTGDGVDIDYLRCIRKKIDFSKMTVESTFLEFPDDGKSRAGSDFNSDFNTDFGG